MSTGSYVKSITEVHVANIDETQSNDFSPTDPFSLQELDTQHEHFKCIQADFRKAEIDIIKIEKVVNPLKREFYKSAKELMVKARQYINIDTNVNERYLYHGTNAKKEYMCEEGLDDKLSREGCFGRGIYFSDNVKKCLKYSNRQEGDTGLILCVRTLLGDSKIFQKGEQARDLKREPEKSVCGGLRFYDSVQGCPGLFREFVVYRGSHTLIEYLITHSKVYSVPLLTSVPTEDGTTFTQHKTSEESVSDTSDSSSGEDIYDSSDDGDISTGSLKEESDPENIKGMTKSEEIDITKKREIFSKRTKEETDCVKDSFLMATNYDVDLATDLFLNQEKITQELEILVNEMQANEMQKNVTFHPFGFPHYNSKKWKKLSESEREKCKEKFTSVFMNVTALGMKDKEFAKNLLKQNNYEIDATISSYFETFFSLVF